MKTRNIFIIGDKRAMNSVGDIREVMKDQLEETQGDISKFYSKLKWPELPPQNRQQRRKQQGINKRKYL